MDFGETLDRYHISVQESTGFSCNICFILKKGVEELNICYLVT